MELLRHPSLFYWHHRVTGQSWEPPLDACRLKMQSAYFWRNLIGNPLACNQCVLMYASRGRLCRYRPLILLTKNEIRFWLGNQ